MKLVVRTLLVCSFCLFLLGCGSGSRSADRERVSVNLKPGGRQEACKVLSDYADRVEGIYMQYDWVEMPVRLENAEADYRTQMSKLAEAGKWTPRLNIGKAVELPILIGRFHGALESCKIERMHNDSSLVGCDHARNLKAEMEKLCLK